MTENELENTTESNIREGGLMASHTDLLPPELKAGWVYSRVLRSVGDTVNDEDQLPDGVPAVGEVVFAPDVSTVQVNTDGVGTTVVKDRITCKIHQGVNQPGDPDRTKAGLLIDPAGSVGGVYLSEGGWTATYQLLGASVPPVKFVLTEEHTKDNPLDLALVAGLTPSPTVKFVVNEQVYHDTLAARDEIWGLLEYVHFNHSGRNLVLDSKLEVSSGGYNIWRGYLSEPWEEGARYTVSIKGTINEPNFFRIYRNQGRTVVMDLTRYDAETGVYTGTFVCPAQYEDRDPHEFAVFNHPQETATSASLEWIKIERGAMGTDWTPAPEDYIEKSSLLNRMYPVGSIYMDMGADLTTCPIQKTLGGTWEREADGRVLVGYASNQPEHNAIGKTGGAKTHTLTTAQMPAHSHHIYNYNEDAPEIEGHSHVLSTTAVSDIPNGGNNVKTTDTGGGAAHNNLQPYLTVNIWRRTA